VGCACRGGGEMRLEGWMLCYQAPRACALIPVHVGPRYKLAYAGQVHSTAAQNDHS
jgi:hypothetical protein